MRPLEPKKSMEGVSRARMYIKKNLDLFIGYPGLNGGWVSQPEGKAPQIIHISREHIHKATFTINKLVRDFPRALPKIVGDVGKWSTRYNSLLEIMKLSIHSGKPFKDSLIDVHPEFGEGEKKLHNRLIKENPFLTYVINSFSWLTCLKPESFKEALSWLGKNMEYVDAICRNLGTSEGLRVIIELWRLSNEVGEKRTDLIVRWASEPGTFNTPMVHGYSYAYGIYSALGRKKSSQTFSHPEPRFGKDFVQWVGWLSMQDNKTAKRSIDLFGLVCDISFIGRWEQWWKSLNACLKDTEKIPRPLAKNHPFVEKLNHIRDKIKSIGENSPPEIKPKLLFELVVKWSEKSKSNDFEEVFKALDSLPLAFDNIPVRMAFLKYWDNLFEENSISKKKIILRIIKESIRYMKGYGDFSKAVKPWEKVLDNWKAGRYPDIYVFTVDDEILEQLTTEKDVSMFFDLLNELSADKSIGEFKEEEKGNLLLLFKLQDREYLRNSLIELRKLDLSCQYLSYDLLKLSTEIARNSHKDFGIVMKILLNNAERYNDIGSVLRTTLGIFRKSEFDSFLLDAVIGGQLRIICDISLEAGLMEYFGEKSLALPLPILSDNGWILRYPEGLREVLLKLASADMNAEASARRILSRYFPDADLIAKEIKELSDKIKKGEDQEGLLRKRIDKLKKVLMENHAVLGEQKLKNLANKLRHAAMIGLLKRWNDETDTRFKAYMTGYLGLKEFPCWLERKNVLETILSTAELEQPFQEIVHRILARRASGLPWDFRDEPQNKAFIERLKAADINMAPWLDGKDTVIGKLKNGEDLVVSIERDPIEIFSMGQHFKTCLSPGGINFFSVFSNIIDINKQVVYGKTVNGMVKARALIALTDEGGILSFYPYCNDRETDFQNILKEFIHQLAQKMRTVVLSAGSVSKLIAPDWYDDGPYDLTEKFPFAMDGSDFRKSIKELDTPGLLAAMQKAVEPAGLNELTVPLFVFLPELKECKKLMEVLFPYLLKFKNLPSDVLLRYSEALLENGGFQMLEMLLPRIEEHILNIYDTYSYWAIRSWMDLLIKISPGKALSVLRKTRSKGIRKWEDETGERIAAAGMAYLKLNRRKKAADLFSLCLKKDTEKEIKEFCSKQLEELME